MLISLSIGISKSAKYNRIVSLIKTIPGCSFSNGSYLVEIEEVYTFIKYQSVIDEIISTCINWKTSIIKVCGNRLTGAYYHSLLKEKLGKYWALFESPIYCCSGNIKYEDLPLPFVYYPDLSGSFFGFAEDIGKEIFFCECERKAIENYLQLRQVNPLINYIGPKTFPLGADAFPIDVAKLSKDWKDSPLNHIHFRENLCHRCNKKVPREDFNGPGLFMQKYGWYVKQEYFKLGIDNYKIAEASVLPEDCPPDIYDNIRQYATLFSKIREATANNSPEYIKKIKELRLGIDRVIENSVREQFGFKKVGEAWVGESMLFEITKTIFEGEKSIRHYRPNWLEGLEIDIYYPDLRIGFEYQGIQHFQAVEHWGGKAQLEIQQEHDRRKKQLCLEHGDRLICINYDEPLTVEHIHSRIQE